jgi:CRP-like cAMP-binding protein
MVFSPTPGPASRDRDGFRDLLEASYRKRTLVQVPAGSTVPLLRNSLWLVARGMVKLGSLTIHGDELLLGLAGPGEPFGEPLNAVEVFEARALVNTDLLCLTTAEALEDGALASTLLQALAQRQRQSQALLALLGLRRVEDRLRGFLELLAASYGQPCEAGLRLDLRLTHQEMASALGTTRVTVTRMLGLLRVEGWLRFDGERRLIIPAAAPRGRR